MEQNKENLWVYGNYNYFWFIYSQLSGLKLKNATIVLLRVQINAAANQLALSGEHLIPQNVY